MDSYREAEGREILQVLYKNPTTKLAVDSETSGLKVANGKDHCIGVSIAAVIDGVAVAHYFGIDHPVGVNVSRETLAMLLYVLHQPRRLIFANVQFDILSLATTDDPQGPLDEADFIDICTMAHLIDENEPFQGKGLDALAMHYLGEPGKLEEFDVHAIAAFEDSGLELTMPGVRRPKLSLKWEKSHGWPNTTPEMMFNYATVDAISTWRVEDVLEKHPAWLELPEGIWPEKQEMVRVLLAMKRRGVELDLDLIRDFEGQAVVEMARIRDELGLDPAKRTDQATLFIERLGLPVLKSGKTGPSFDKSVMAQYDDILAERGDATSDLVRTFRGWQTAAGLMYRPYLNYVDDDGALRCGYKLHGTTTGRLSCSEPNLQQIPKSTDKVWNGRTKEMFVARPGFTLINADFSQLELRLATAYAGEAQLKEVFEAGRDIFDEMSKQLGMARHDTKTLVYSMQYGAGIKRIMSAFHVTREAAEAIRNNYFATYPRFKNLSDICSNRVMGAGKVRIWSGRYRRFKYPSSESHKAMNSVIQGGAADVVERVMIRCFRELDNDDCRMLLQVHDSLTWEVRTELVEEYMPRIEALMSDVHGGIGAELFDVKFHVDVTFWSEREEKNYLEWKQAAA